VADTAAIYRDPVAAETTVAHRVAKAVTSTAETTAMASSAVASTAASCERDCAGRRCRYAEHDGRSRCNYLFAHFSKLPMFHLICGARLICATVSGLPKRGCTKSLGLAVSARRSFTGDRSSASRLLLAFQIGNCEPITANTSTAVDDSIKAGEQLFAKPKIIC
jgi:hypothetical protein